MKNTAMLLCLIFLSFGFSKDTRALVPIKSDLQIKVTIIPTATPTPVIYKKIDPSDVNLKLIATSTPTLTPTLTVTPSPEKVVVTQIVTSQITPRDEVKEENKEEVKEVSQNNLKDIFTKITLGLLAAIIIIQVWPKRKKISDK